MEPQRTARLETLAQDCSKQFNDLSLHEQDQDDTGSSTIDRFWALRQSADFNLWCSKLGVDIEGHRSIDFRLKDVPEICDILFQLLQSLQADLEELLQPRGQEVDSETEIPSAEKDTDSESDDGSLFFASLSSSSNESGSQAEKQNADTAHEKHIVELKKHVRDTLDRLQGQARRIEHAGAQHRKKRVDIYKEKERPKQIYDGIKQLGAWKAN